MDNFSQLESIKETIVSFNLVSLMHQLEVIEKLLSDSKTIDIAVLGQFKVGKSSFINSFIDYDILPVGVIPVTSVITRLSYGDAERAFVKFEDGKETEIKLTELANFIDESKNPENKKKVAIVDISLPSFVKFKGLRLVDTPGIGSYHRHNTETTLNWSPELGISILAISSERPLSENEINLLKDLLNYTPKVVILLTKTDLFDEVQMNKIKVYIISSLKKEFNRDFALYEYSTKKGTNDKRSKIENELIEPLAENIDNELQKIIEHKISNLKKETVNYLEIAHQASLKAESEKEKIKALILDEKMNFDYIIRELRLISNSYTGQTRLGLVNILMTYRTFIIQRLFNEFDSEHKSWNGNLYRLTRKFEEWGNKILHNELFTLSDGHHYQFIENLQKAKQHYAHFLKIFRERLNQNIEDVFKIKLENEEWQIDIEEIRQPDIIISRAFDFHLDLLWFLFPMCFFRKTFIKHFRKQIPSMAETNLYRLASDYTERINREILKIERQAEQNINIELNTIESIISNDENKSSYILKKIQTLKI